MFSIYFVIVVIYATLSNRILRQQEILKEKQEGDKLLNIYQTVLNSLSHEFRTPLAAIITATDTLKENSPYLTDKMKLEILNEVEIASNRLKEQTDNLLNMGRLDSGMYKVKTEWCDINDLINNIKTKDLIILDEPTDGFSSEQLDKMLDVLHELDIKQLIMVSHEVKMESFVQNIIRIHKNEHNSEEMM